MLKPYPDPNPEQSSITEAARFLQLFDSTAKKYTFQTFDDNEERKKQNTAPLKNEQGEFIRNKRGEIVKGRDPFAKIIHGTLDQCWHQLQSLNDQGAGVFVTVNETDFKGRKDANIVRIRGGLIDLDGTPLDPVLNDAVLPKPHIVIETSPGHWQTVTLLHGIALAEFTAMQEALAARFNTDPSVKDLPRVMRLPGFFHRKGKPFLVKIVSGSDAQPYDGTEFLTKLLGNEASSSDDEASRFNSYRHPRQNDDKWRDLNTEALANLNKWVPKLFPGAAFQKGGYRISSAALGRDLQEDLSITPQGIKDFGVHDIGDAREGKRTPIDLIIEWSGKDKLEAFEWLREQLGYHDADDDDADAGADKTRANTIDRRPEIRILTDEISEPANRAEQILIEAKVPFYRRGPELVRPIIEEVEASKGRRTKVASLERVIPDYLRDILNRNIRFTKFDRRSKKWLPIKPPPETAPTILARKGEWKFPTIAGVISTPTMRPDGSLLTEPGYDEVTRLLLVAPPPMPAIPVAPTRADALAALVLLEDLLTEFPFTSDGEDDYNKVSQAVALSALITPVVRGAFPVTPMHVNRAPVASAGKSYLFDIVASIAIGQLMPVIAAGRSEEETEKRVGAALMAGKPVFSIDNIDGEIGGDSLCQCIERQNVNVRVLGKSDLVRIDVSTSMFGTGNNLAIAGDLTRRVVVSSLDPEMERPELRVFKKDPVATVLADRGKYIAACLTICRAYINAGRPNIASPKLASFEGWSDCVRSALMWLGKADPVKSIEIARAEDPESARLANMLSAWVWAIDIGDEKRITLADAVQLSQEGKDSYDGPKRPELLNAIEAVVAERKKNSRGASHEMTDVTALSTWLQRYKKRVIGGLRFMNRPNTKAAATWWVEHKDGKEAEERYRAELAAEKEAKAAAAEEAKAAAARRG